MDAVERNQYILDCAGNVCQAGGHLFIISGEVNEGNQTKLLEATKYKHIQRCWYLCEIEWKAQTAKTVFIIININKYLHVLTCAKIHISYYAFTLFSMIDSLKTQSSVINT